MGRHNRGHRHRYYHGYTVVRRKETFVLPVIRKYASVKISGKLFVCIATQLCRSNTRPLQAGSAKSIRGLSGIALAQTPPPPHPPRAVRRKPPLKPLRRPILPDWPYPWASRCTSAPSVYKNRCDSNIVKAQQKLATWRHATLPRRATDSSRDVTSQDGRRTGPVAPRSPNTVPQPDPTALL
ncbi:unnamed protein product, partial [Iphiclides podalirius]